MLSKQIIYDKISIRLVLSFAEVIFLTLFLTIIQLIVSLGLIVAVLMQSGTSAGLSGSIAGAGETFFGKKKGMDKVFSKLATVCAVLFLAITLIIAII